MTTLLSFIATHMSSRNSVLRLHALGSPFPPSWASVTWLCSWQTLFFGFHAMPWAVWIPLALRVLGQHLVEHQLDEP